MSGGGRENTHTVDPPEKIAICLGCTREVCPGRCELVDKAVKGMPREWKIDEDEFLALHGKGWRDIDLAARFGVSRAAVSQYRKVRGLKRNRAVQPFKVRPKGDRE